MRMGLSLRSASEGRKKTAPDTSYAPAGAARRRKTWRPYVAKERGRGKLEAAVGFEPTKYGGFANRCLDPLGYAALANPRDAHVHMPAGIEALGF